MCFPDSRIPGASAEAGGDELLGGPGGEGPDSQRPQANGDCTVPQHSQSADGPGLRKGKGQRSVLCS